MSERSTGTQLTYWSLYQEPLPSLNSMTKRKMRFFHPKALPSLLLLLWHGRHSARSPLQIVMPVGPDWQCGEGDPEVIKSNHNSNCRLTRVVWQRQEMCKQPTTAPWVRPRPTSVLGVSAVEASPGISALPPAMTRLWLHVPGCSPEISWLKGKNA